MGKGQRTKAGHIIQMIYHGADPNRFNPNGKRVVAHNAEDYDYTDGIEFDKLGRKGAKALIANVPLEEMWTGKISGPLHYNLMDDQILPFWIAKGTETPITVDGVACIDTEYVRPQLDRADREFFSIEEGKAGGGAALGCYGMFTSFKWTSKRGNKGKSRFEVGFVTQAAVRRNTLTGGTAQNHKIRVTAANVAGPVGLSIVVPGLAAKVVSLAIGDTIAAMQAKFTAIGLTAAITGTIATGAGKRQDISYSGNGPITIGGYTLNLTTPDTVSQVVAGVKTANATRTTLTGTGTITAGSTGTIFSPVVASGNTSSNATFLINGQLTGPATATTSAGQVMTFDLGSLQTVGRIQVYDQVGPNSGGTAAVQGSVSSNFASSINMGTAQSAPNTNTWTDVNNSSSGGVAIRYIRFTVNAGPDWSLSEMRVLGVATPASVNITLSDNASVGNVADLPVTGTDAISAGTALGAVGGQIDVEFTNPANTLISASKATGDANYALTTPQYGGDGSILQAMKADDPIMPGHLFLYSANTPAGLEDEANLVGQIGEWEIDDPKICMPVSHHVRVNDPERHTLPATYNAHAEEESQEDGIKLNITMDADENGEVIAGMQSLLRASGSRLVSLPRYWRIAAIHPGSPQRVWIDFYGSIGASAPVKWGGSVEQYTFVYDLLENKTAPWNFKAKTRRLA